jgi:hypothetical protein
MGNGSETRREVTGNPNSPPVRSITTFAEEARKIAAWFQETVHPAMEQFGRELQAQGRETAIESNRANEVCLTVTRDGEVEMTYSIAAGIEANGSGVRLELRTRDRGRLIARTVMKMRRHADGLKTMTRDDLIRSAVLSYRHVTANAHDG